MPTINGKACVANGRNLIIQSDLKSGFFGEDGSVNNASINFYSDNYIPTNGSTVFTFSSPDYTFIGSYWGDRIIMYDSDKNYLGYQRLASATQTLSQSNVAYIRFSINTKDEGSTTANSSDWLANHRYKLEKGSVATPLTPAPVDKVFSNGRQVYGRNLWSDKKAVSYYISGGTGLPTKGGPMDAAMIDPVTVPSTATKLVLTIYNPNKVVNTHNGAKPSFFKVDTYLGFQPIFHLTGDTVQKKEWPIPAGATKVYLNTLLGTENAESFDFSIKTKYEFDTATPWSPAPEDVM